LEYGFRTSLVEPLLVHELFNKVSFEHHQVINSNDTRMFTSFLTTIPMFHLGVVIQDDVMAIGGELHFDFEAVLAQTPAVENLFGVYFLVLSLFEPGACGNFEEELEI
jgi:hypothetical protein